MSPRDPSRLSKWRLLFVVHPRCLASRSLRAPCPARSGIRKSAIPLYLLLVQYRLHSDMRGLRLLLLVHASREILGLPCSCQVKVKGSLSWCQAPMTRFRFAPSLTRGRLCSLQCNPSGAEPATTLYCLIWRARSQEQGGPSCRLLRLVGHPNPPPHGKHVRCMGSVTSSNVTTRGTSSYRCALKGTNRL
jgi:hypothetical protein